MSLRHATCAFCGLLCDDLEVEVDDAGMRVTRGACVRSEAGYARIGAAVNAGARIRGEAASLEAALDRAAGILRNARRPQIGGLDIDVAGMRATLALARRIGAVVDHAGADHYRNLHALQEFGGITTTLAEVRNRADLVLLVGDGWKHRYPRFLERMVAPAPIHGAAGKRRIVTVTALDPAVHAALPRDAEVIALNAPLTRLPALASMLPALVAGRVVERRRLADVAQDALARCVRWLHEARYGVIVWCGADLDWPHAELTVQAIAHLVRELNKTTRFAALPLAGDRADLTANAVQTWQAGVPLPASYANGTVDFDPYRYSLRDVVTRGEADALLWVSSMSRTPPPPTGRPCIALGRADMDFMAPPDVRIPVATPGIDAAGHLLRSDQVIMMRLPRLRDSGLPAVSTVMDELLARLD